MMSAVLQRVADWHGVQATDAWRDAERFQKQKDAKRAEIALAMFIRHAAIADRMWRA